MAGPAEVWFLELHSTASTSYLTTRIDAIWSEFLNDFSARNQKGQKMAACTGVR